MTGATIQCLSHSANPAIKLGAGRVNRTLVGEVQALCTPTVLDQQTLELVRSLELRSGAYRAPALPVELYQRSWRRFERRSRTYEARALPTELHQRKTVEVAGRIALPMICFAGRCLAVLATPPHNIGAEGGTRTRGLDVGNVGSWPLDDFRPKSRIWSEQRELNSRHRVGGPRHQPLYHARNGGR